MSSISVMGLTSTLFIAAFVAILWLVGKANDLGVVVEIGAIQGIPISTKSRWLFLYQAWAMYALAITASSGAIGFAVLRIGQRATEADARSVAYLYAFILFMCSFGNLLTSISAFVAHYAAIRQAEAG